MLGPRPTYRSGVAAPPAYGTVYLTPTTGAFTAANTVFYGTPIKPNANYTGTCTYAGLTAGNCAFTNPYAEVQPKTENINLIASFNKKLPGDWMLDLKGSIFDSKG